MEKEAPCIRANEVDLVGLKLVWPAWEAVESWVLKTHRSEEPESKSMFMVWPPMEMGERYSTSPCSGVAMTIPVPVPLAAAEAVPVDLEVAAEEVDAAFPLFFLALSSVKPVRPATAELEIDSTMVSEPALAAFMASTNPCGRPMLNFLYALIKALVPAPGLRPLKLGFGTRSTMNDRFWTDAWPAWGAGAARTNVMRARRKRACIENIEGMLKREGRVAANPHQVAAFEIKK